MVKRAIILIIAFIKLTLSYGQEENNRLPGSNDPDLIKADSINLQARKYMFSGKKDSAKIYLEKALILAHKTGNNIMIARCYVDFANLYFLQSNYKSALEYVKLAWPYVQVIDHYEVKITGILLKANSFNFSGGQDSAIFYFKKAEQYNFQKMPYRNWAVYVALGELFTQLDDVPEAEKYFLKAYNLTARNGSIPDRTSVVMLFINFYLARNKPAAAGHLIAEYNELVSERKRLKIDDPVQNLVTSITNGKLENNVDFMREVKASSLRSGELNQAMIANGYLINYFEKRKKFGEALILANEGAQLAEKSGVLYTIYGAKRIQYDLLKKSGKYMEAGKMADSLFVLKDSLLVIQRREQLYDLEKKYESEKKEKEIELLTSKSMVREKEIALLISDKKMAAMLLEQQILQRNALSTENRLMDSIVRKEQAYSMSLNKEKEKEAALFAALGRENLLKEDQLIKERNLRSILIVGATMLLLAGGIILFQYRKQRVKNLFIQRQSDDMQVLMKEIHHRVKNNLQVISSLLDMQSLTISDNQASEAVKEGKNRVQSMALIHQNLYSEGNIKGIRTKEYINNLLQSLCDSYNVTNDKVKVKTDIDDLNLDVDTMIPLGLVLNELVSNSLKYAFKNGEIGELSVILKKLPEHLLLRVSDNGAGYPGEVNIKEGKSFGMKMIRAFAQKLKASLNIYNRNGAVTEMMITKYNVA